MSTRSRIRSKFWTLLYTLPVALLMVLFLSSVAWAGEGEPVPDGAGETSSASADAPSGLADDGGNWELGIHGSAGDLTAATAAERAGMNHLSGASNWVLNYRES